MSENVKYFQNYTEIGQIQQKISENRTKLDESGTNAMENYRISRVLKVISKKEFKEMIDEHDPKAKFLRARNTQILFRVDPEDWELTKHVRWHQRGVSDLVTDRGQTFEEYVGITGERLHPFGPRDKRRGNYHGC